MGTPWSFIRGFEKCSFCDWPGHSSCVLFTGGCNLLCPTCHNGSLAWWPETLPVISKDEIMNHIRSRAGWLDGIVISGGEPTRVPGLADLLADLRELGLPIKVDTNGMRPAVVREILHAGLADMFFVDVKGPWAKYPELTGNRATPEQAQRNLGGIFEMAQAKPEAFRFRVTQVPLLDDHDVSETLRQLPQGFSLTIQEYVPPRRSHAETDSQTGWLPGDMVARQDRQRHSEGAESERSQGSAASEALSA